MTNFINNKNSFVSATEKESKRGAWKRFKEAFFSRPHIIDRSNIGDFIRELPDDIEFPIKGYQAKQYADLVSKEGKLKGVAIGIGAVLLGVGVYKGVKELKDSFAENEYRRQ